MFTRLLSAAAIAGAALLSTTPDQVRADSNPLIGQVQAYGPNFCPRSWAAANGQLLAISSNTALFSILGTTFGGNGVTTFGLPNLNNRTPIGYGSGPGLPTIADGQLLGTDSITMTQAQMPSHNHSFNAINEAGTKHGPGTDILALAYNQDGTNLNLYHDGPPNKVMDPAMIGSSGGGQALPKRSPYLVINWCIATQGIYPSRN